MIAACGARSPATALAARQQAEEGVPAARQDDRHVEVNARFIEPGGFADLVVARRRLAPVDRRQVATVTDASRSG
jgi:hypothetical protein